MVSDIAKMHRQGGTGAPNGFRNRLQTTASDDSSIRQAGLEVFENSWEQTHGDPTIESVTSQSSTHRRADERAKRLSSLIKRQYPNIYIQPNIEPQAPYRAFPSAIDRQLARDILVQNRRRTPGFKDPADGIGGPLRRTKTTKQKLSDTNNWAFSESEKRQALEEAVSHGMVAVAEALLDMGLDVNNVTEAAKLKILRRQCNISRPTNYISIAVSKNNADMVTLLASRGTSSINLEEALSQAVRRNLPRMVEILFQFGTDPNAMDGNIFKSAVASQKPDLVRLLLRARVKVHKNFLTKNLPIAVSHGQAEIVSTIVFCGADVHYKQAAALGQAIQNQRIDLVLAIMKDKPTAEEVSNWFSDAFQINSQLTPSEKELLLEVLLCGGANGDNVAKVLVHVVRNGDRSLAGLLVKYGALVQYWSVESLRIAVAAGDLKLLKILLLGEISARRVIELFDSIKRPFVEPRTQQLVSSLLSRSQGATGVPLDKALVDSVEQRLVNTTKVLLNHKARVNYNGAQVLQICISGGDLEIFNMLLNLGRPEPRLMQHVLPQVPSDPQRLRYDMTKSIIDAARPANIPTPILDMALREAVDLRSQPVDLGCELPKWGMFPDSCAARFHRAFGSACAIQARICFRLLRRCGSHAHYTTRSKA